jgi:SNF2 family DNA or RNA helicase
MAFEFKQPPMGHQLVALRRAWNKNEYALFHEMGTGKTFTAINLAAARYGAGQINALVVICPTPIKNIWEDELEKFCPISYSTWIYESGDKPSIWIREKRDELKVFIVGVESLSIRNGQSVQQLEYFQRFHKFMCVVDESSRIKNWKAARSQTVVKVGGWAEYRLLLTGTPVTQGLEDLFGQFLFLNRGIIGCKNFFVFRNKYCVMGGFQGKQVLGYQFQEHLFEKVKPYVDYITKDECLDLPDKVRPGPIIVQQSDEQKRVMKQLTDEFTMIDGLDEITVSTVLERMLRYQQVIGGTFPYEEDGEYHTKPILGKNPKLDAMMEYIDDLPEEAKVIIWARFVPEIQYITKVITEEYGATSIVPFYGATSGEERKANSRAFQENPQVRFIVSNQTVGGYGQTWTAATYVIYYSNTFSYEDRYQSEDRAHRKGQHNHVTYQDIEMAVPQDRMILKAIRKKKDLALIVEEALS